MAAAPVLGIATMDFDRDGRDWPHREASRFVGAAGLRFHLQEMGSGPTVLLLHGTGASIHSWRGLAPRLAERFRVIAPDLPGHGFTELPPSRKLSLPGMAAAIAGLLGKLEVRPALVVGHSAGAAILVRMSLDGLIAPRAIVSLNGALLPFRGMASQLFSPLAKLLGLNPFAPRFFAWRATDRRAVERLIAGTGSRIDEAGIDLYARLFRQRSHIAGALGMMANWDLSGLEIDMKRLPIPLRLVAGGDDRAIAPSQAYRVRGIAPEAAVTIMAGLGHLAHEERPDLVAALVMKTASDLGLIPAIADPSSEAGRSRSPRS